MRTIRLNGELGKKFGRVHKLDVRTPAEAIRALCANHPGFYQELVSSADRGVAYRCVVDKDVINEDQLTFPMSRIFSITPVVQGAGKVLGVIAGIAMIVVGIGTGQTWLVDLGIAVTLGGIAMLLTPVPKSNDGNGETNENRYFDGPENVTAQGASVPVGYGRVIAGSAVISASISVEQQPDPTFAYDFMINGLYGGNVV